ncbi:hypothetical protein [Microbulbifer pacificus]|uniref:Uncharacterized protein n=1 Tax=Microbulbifer pacificus TaxID=407164 RepID=A0AAU0MWZ9_9GAMM|nr:hypothetical protein [Microbulbifer pacificus]WOX04637.1 hypothetical protein R5R33_12910 [Microbulbifer pacificus]
MDAQTLTFPPSRVICNVFYGYGIGSRAALKRLLSLDDTAVDEKNDDQTAMLLEELEELEVANSQVPELESKVNKQRWEIDALVAAVSPGGGKRPGTKESGCRSWP